MTDGATRLVTPFAETDWRGLLKLAVESGAVSVIDRVRGVEASDPDRERWPRFKTNDDATIAVIGDMLTTTLAPAQSRTRDLDH